MTDTLEHRCIQLASDAKLTVAKRRLSELESIRFDSPLKGLGGFVWETDSRRKIQQILLVPLAVLLMALLVPLAYLVHIWGIREERRALKRQIRALSMSVQSDVPSTKTIEALWKHCGLESRALSWDECLELLARWIGILYGEACASNINVESRALAIAQRQVEANMPFYEGKERPHFHFTPPIEALVGVLSNELPHYDKVVPS